MMRVTDPKTHVRRYPVMIPFVRRLASAAVLACALAAVINAQNRPFQPVTGDLLWEYSHEPADGTRPGSAVRGLSLYGDKVFLNTVDARIVALDAQSGK